MLTFAFIASKYSDCNLQAAYNNFQKTSHSLLKHIQPAHPVCQCMDPRLLKQPFEKLSNLTILETTKLKWLDY